MPWQVSVIVRENYVVVDEQASAGKPRKGGGLVLVSFALVLMATALRVASALTGGLALVYLSIACSGGAAVMLIAARRANRGGPAVPAERPRPPRPPRPQWLRVGGRSVGALVCLSGLVSIGGRDEVKTYGVSCGSISEALRSHVGNCAGNARMSILGFVVLAIGFIVLTISALRLLRARRDDPQS